jgi:peroxiredoxin Q/BCP
VLGASFDTPEENKAFAQAQSFGFHLLADVDRTVGTAYEVARQPDEQFPEFARRIAYLIDPDGVIGKAYEVSDVKAFASQVLDDLVALRA